MTNQNRSKRQLSDDSILSGGDVDVDQYQASVVGEEAVGGTMATPDQSIVDDIGSALGVELSDYESVRMTDKLSDRDNQRWELDPNSKEESSEASE